MRRFLTPNLCCLFLCTLWTSAVAVEKPPQTIKDVGAVVDPDGDCQVKDDEGTITITIPTTHHDLTYTDDYQKLNSPRILQDIKGDFRVEGRVETFDLPNEKASSGGKYSFVSSGLLVWQDDHNFIRMDRAAVGNSPFIWVERFQDAKSVSHKMRGIENKDTLLRVTRSGDKFTFETSEDGKEWSEVHSEEAKLADQLKVGALAINTTVEEFSVKLKDFKLSETKE
jgi:regulation of enolase protein 1 (concanavalin A-like superfamily)